MPYFEQADLEALIPRPWLVEGLCDDATAETDEAVNAAAAAGFAKVQALAENEVNGVLSARYAVPMAVANAGLAAFLKTLCVLIGAEAVFERRGKDMTEGRMKRLEAARKRLASIAKGTDPLSPAVKPTTAPGLVFSEESRVHSDSLAA